MLHAWTEAAANLTAGKTARALGDDASAAAGDSGDALDLGQQRLTITFGFGPGLFIKDGHDRYGLAARRPQALVDLPRFNGDQLAPAQTGGDLSIQACADDPQVAFHAVRQLVQMAYGAAQLRWTQTGFLSPPAKKGTPRNLMGFKDGTQRPTDLAKFVWVGSEGPDWMQRRQLCRGTPHPHRPRALGPDPVDFQEQVVGRHKY